MTSSFIWLFWQTGARSAAAFLAFAVVLEPLVPSPPQEGSGRQGGLMDADVIPVTLPDLYDVLP